MLSVFLKNERQDISFRGTWKFENNKIILDIEEEKKAIGGKTVPADGLAVEHLEDYQVVTSKNNHIVEYTIEDYKENEYIQLENEKLYQLSIDEEYINSLKNLAINGYGE